jgi:DNA-directed RNA polymerase subunit omega
MVNPRIEELLGRAGSKFTLVTLGATRARQINAYFNRLSDGQGGIPPQVASTARKPLSIAFEEISEGLIVPVFENAEDEGDTGETDATTDEPADEA